MSTENEQKKQKLEKELEICFVTGNNSKFNEAKKILEGCELQQGKAKLNEYQGSLEEIATMKAEDAFKVLQKPCIVDDSGLYFSGLGGFPGPYTKDFLGAMSLEDIVLKLRTLSDIRAKARCIIAYKKDENSRPLLFSGDVEGLIVAPRGENGFDWDAIFLLQRFGDYAHAKTFGQMTTEEKNECSPRKIALEKMRDHLLKEKVQDFQNSLHTSQQQANID